MKEMKIYFLLPVSDHFREKKEILRLLYKMGMTGRVTGSLNRCPDIDVW